MMDKEGGVSLQCWGEGPENQQELISGLSQDTDLRTHVRVDFQEESVLKSVMNYPRGVLKHSLNYSTLDVGMICL